MIQIHDLEQGTPEWHKIRQGKYTGSNASKLLKFGAIEYARTEATSFGGNFYTKRGHILEEEAIELYDEIYSRSALRPGFITNSAYPACGYSPDGIDGDLADASTILLEVKCFNEKKHLAIAKGEIPIEILAQIHFGLLICNLKKARLILYNPDLDAQQALKIIDIRHNRNIQSNFKRILGKGRTVAHA